MSHRRSAVIVPAQRTPRYPDGEAVPGARRSRHDAAAGSDVTRIDLGMSEWVLVLTPAQPGGALAGQPPGSLAGMLARPVTSRLELVRVPPPADGEPGEPPGLAGPRLGPAVLHYQHGQTVIYCAATQITDFAARVLSALAERLMYEIAEPGSRIAVTPAGHFDLLQDACPGPRQPGDLGTHPAKAVVAGHEVTFKVCADLIDDELARALGSLWTAQAACLPRPRMRGPGTRCPGPAGARS